ncbi:MAG: dihydroneopterin aldolase, partial [Muribaculaceae bacterium]|nr:dihydroneopterin aldolase [Muribaculaceae bacterium]
MSEFEIQLRDVLFFAHHGVMPEERVTGNQYCVNVRLRLDASDFDVDKDDLASTISYAEVFHILKEVMSEPVALLETLAV